MTDNLQIGVGQRHGVLFHELLKRLDCLLTLAISVCPGRIVGDQPGHHCNSTRTECRDVGPRLQGYRYSGAADIISGPFPFVQGGRGDPLHAVQFVIEIPH